MDQLAWPVNLIPKQIIQSKWRYYFDHFEFEIIRYYESISCDVAEEI